MRSLFFLVILAGLGWYLFGGPSYSRTVGRQPADVANAVANLDIRTAPGAPGSTAVQGTGEVPTFTVERKGDRVIHVVHARDQVAMRLITRLVPTDDGKSTKVTAWVERGDAPDDYVSPAFRSKGTTMGLFSLVLDDKLNKLVDGPLVWDPKCDAIIARFENRNGGFPSPQAEPNTLGGAMARTARDGMAIAGLSQELRAAGCPDSAPAGYSQQPEPSSPPPVPEAPTSEG